MMTSQEGRNEDMRRLHVHVVGIWCQASCRGTTEASSVELVVVTHLVPADLAADTFEERPALFLSGTVTQGASLREGDRGRGTLLARTKASSSRKWRQNCSLSGTLV